MVKRFVIHARRLGFGEDGKQRIDSRFDWTLPEQIRAKAMNGADLRFLEPAERAVEPVALRRTRLQILLLLLQAPRADGASARPRPFP